MRKIKFVNGEFYHIFNRGVDKRIIYPEQLDLRRFFQSMEAFNTIEPIGSIYENLLNKKEDKGRLGNLVPKSFKQEKLVNFICYCLNPNHYHFILEQLVENGISKFMHRLGIGYTNYFNEKHKRSGSLFQGSFKAVHIDSDEQLLHTSVYVNLNDRVHQLGNSVPKLSSWSEYTKKQDVNFCSKDIILDRFNDINEYKRFAKDSLKDIKERKEMERFLLE